MPGNSFGKLFRITTFGESHGKGLGVVVDGCPAGLELDLDAVQGELARRKPGQNKLVSPRKEDDALEVFSGLFEGKTTGTPLMFLILNKDAKSKDYSDIKNSFRPGHADFTYQAKYGLRDYRGGGRASARETAARVIGGAIAKQLLASIGVRVFGGVIQIGSVKAQRFDWASVEKNDVRSVDPDAAARMVSEIEAARKGRDSVGGKVRVIAEGVPPGWGEPVFERLDAEIAAAMMSIPAVKAVEFGVGARCAELRGSEMNDRMYPEGFGSNNHGGVLGGISSGAPIDVTISIKPTSSLPQPLDTIDVERRATSIATKGRHDPCVVMRAVPIAEAMLALSLVDYWLIHEAQLGVRAAFSPYRSEPYGLKGRT